MCPLTGCSRGWFWHEVCSDDSFIWLLREWWRCFRCGDEHGSIHQRYRELLIHCLILEVSIFWEGGLGLKLRFWSNDWESEEGFMRHKGEDIFWYGKGVDGLLVFDDFLDGKYHQKWNITFFLLICLSWLLELDRICGRHLIKILLFYRIRWVFARYFWSNLRDRLRFWRGWHWLKTDRVLDFFWAFLRFVWILGYWGGERLIFVL